MSAFSHFLRLHRYSLALAAGVVLLAGAKVRAENWPTWRGPQGIGISSENAFPLTWSDRQNVRWRVDLPDRGNSTPVVWGDRIFLTQAIEKKQRRNLMCLARADGKLLWESGVTSAQREPTNENNPYCTSSPATDGQHVVALFGSPGLYCYDFEGKELWHRELGKVDGWHGSGSSPIIYGALCILNFGPGTDSVLVACDMKSGEIVWKVTPPSVGMFGGGRGGPGGGRGRGGFGPPPGDFGGNFAPPPGGGGGRGGRGGPGGGGFGGFGGFGGAGGPGGSWATPLIVRVGDHDELIVAHAGQISAYEPLTGKEIWKCTGLTAQVISSPAVADGVLVAAGRGMPGGAQVIAVKIGGSGDVTATNRLWQVQLRRDCIGSPAIVAGRVYLSTEIGAMCLDLATGQSKWDKRLQGKGTRTGSWSSVTLAGDKLLVPNFSGDVFVLKAGPEFELLGTNSIGDQATCASLAISDGQVFLRTWDALWCIGAVEK